ncbi:spore germination protein [Paenibacillus sp.]|uniref:spore germination protein n=1 Tax=Paenibacillus sp. TaxID=58172 RepID=UPI002D64359F|nr:spore germination protein [Paenibacillus sp.]HZG85142.1 spore germination protein [Paenibacillus sp.]
MYRKSNAAGTVRSKGKAPFGQSSTAGSSFQEKLEYFKSVFHHTQDFVIRDFDAFGGTSAAALFFTSLVDKDMISETVIKPLMQLSAKPEPADSSRAAELVLKQTMFHADGKTAPDCRLAVSDLLAGSAVVLIEGFDEAIVVNVQKVEQRAVEQPKSEQVIRGPRDGFIENLQTNIALIRTRLPTEQLKMKTLQLGRLTKTSVILLYLDGIANPKLVEDVERRLNAIDIDRILDAGYIEQYVQDNPWSPFPQIRNTERPDVTVGNLLEGRVAILTDGSPYALLCPTSFAMFYQTSEDYNERAGIMSMLRLVRLMALLFSLITPSLYIAILSFHPELIPTKFAVAVASGRAGVPFPTFLEVFVMEVAVEILREATVRMPQQIGGALSIVGVLVIGQAAVMAGFVSPITVVVIALTTISSFATPAYNAAMAFRMLRFPIIAATGLFGFFGLILALFLVNNHLISLRSFGVPFLAPVAPLNAAGLKDAIIRAPIRFLLDRPAELRPRERLRAAPYPNPRSGSNGRGTS